MCKRKGKNGEFEILMPQSYLILKEKVYQLWSMEMLGYASPPTPRSSFSEVLFHQQLRQP